VRRKARAELLRQRGLQHGRGDAAGKHSVLNPFVAELAVSLKVERQGLGGP